VAGIAVASLAIAVQAGGDPQAPNNFSNLEEWYRADSLVTLAAGNNVFS
jgi:hypothetical protein